MQNTDHNTINIIIEIPYGSVEKIEWNQEKQIMEIDRLEPSNFPEPVNYGFIPNTVSGDGDALDIMLISEKAYKTGSNIQVKIIGVMKFNDEGDVDDKIVTVPIENNLTNSLADISQLIIKKIEHYFNHYKDYKKPGLTSIIGWGNVDEAKTIIEKSIERYNSK